MPEPKEELIHVPIWHTCDEPGTCPVAQLTQPGRRWVPTWVVGLQPTKDERGLVVMVLLEDDPQKRRLDYRQIMTCLSRVTTAVVLDAVEHTMEEQPERGRPDAGFLGN